jgi:hypothetical protein
MTMVLSAMPSSSSLAKTGLALGLGFEVRPDVHAGAVPPDKKWLFGLDRLVHEAERRRGDFLVHRFHAFFG